MPLLPYFDNFNNGGVTQDINIYDPSYAILGDVTKKARVVSNQATNDGSSNCNTVYAGASNLTDDHSVELTLRDSVSYTTLLVRANGTFGFNFQSYYWDVQAGHFGYILNSGFRVSLQTGIVLPSLDDVVKLGVIGASTPTSYLYQNGILIATIVDSGALGPLSSGFPGFSIDGNNGASIDDATYANFSIIPPQTGLPFMTMVDAKRF